MVAFSANAKAAAAISTQGRGRRIDVASIVGMITGRARLIPFELGINYKIQSNFRLFMGLTAPLRPTRIISLFASGIY
jgi:hypothetical protein